MICHAEVKYHVELIIFLKQQIEIWVCNCTQDHIQEIILNTPLKNSKCQKKFEQMLNITIY